MKSDRRGLLAKIHIAKKELNLTDDQYRNVLREKFGVESSSKLRVSDLVSLVDHFRALGWQQKPAAPSAPRHPLCRKIWAQCYAMKRPVPAYADALARQMFKIEKLVWCNPDELRSISAALAYQQRREGVARG